MTNPLSPKKLSGPDCVVEIKLTASPRTKKHQSKAQMAHLALMVNILELLVRMEPELNRQKIHVHVLPVLP